MIICIVSIEAKEGVRGALVRLISRCAAESQKEAGCLSYELYSATDNNQKAVLVEAWKNGDALLSHFQTGHYKELIEDSRDMRAKPDDVQMFEADETRLSDALRDKTSLIEVISAITERGSVRRFSDEPVDPEVIKTVLRAGFCAPSAQNKRPWHFVVVNDKTALSHLSSLSPHWKSVKGAQACIMVCGDRSIQDVPEFIYEDCAAATQNMLLCIHGLHLGGVWGGISSVTPGYDGIIEMLRLPSSVIPVSFVALGHPVEETARTDRFDNDKVHYNAWG